MVLHTLPRSPVAVRPESQEPPHEPGGSLRLLDGPANEALSARVEELGRLQALVISTVAHELRTPLTVLRAHAEMLEARADEFDPETRASLTAMAFAIARLQSASDGLVSELREGAGGAEDALRDWLHVEPGARRIRPAC